MSLWLPMNVQRGVTLIETIVFLVVISVALVTLLRVFDQAVLSKSSVDPVVRIRALELAQAQLDEVLSRKFDENTPTGGVPACGTLGGSACLGIVADTGLDDVGDYNGFLDASNPGHSISVAVIEAGTDLGLSSNLARLITVTVTYGTGDQLSISAYKVNF